MRRIVLLIILFNCVTSWNYAQSLKLEARYKPGDAKNLIVNGKREGIWVSEPDSIITGVKWLNHYSSFTGSTCKIAVDEKNEQAKLYCTYSNDTPKGLFQYILFDTLVIAEGAYVEGKIEGAIVSIFYFCEQDAYLPLIYSFILHDAGVMNGLSVNLSATRYIPGISGISFETMLNGRMRGLRYDGEKYILEEGKFESKCFPLYKSNRFMVVQKCNGVGAVKREWVYIYNDSGKVKLYEPWEYSFFRRYLNLNKLCYPLKKIARGEISVDEVNLR